MTGRVLRTILRAYPLLRPRAVLLKCLPRVPDQFAPVPLRGGLRLVQCYSGNDVVSKSLFWLGEFDPWVNHALRRLARPGDTVVDVGANIGATALCLAQSVGGTGKVIAFEPFPRHLDKLRANVEGNHLKQIIIQPIALYSSPGMLRMSMPDESHQGMTHVGGSGENTRLVEADTFDRVIQRLGAVSVTVCKIDVEGHEQHVLDGMEQTLSTGLIQSFVFEHHRNSGDSETDNPVLNQFLQNDYRVFRLHKSFFRSRGVEFGGNGPGEPTADHVAVRRGSEAEKRWN
jgi:FkbM family methyltransferase